MSGLTPMMEQYRQIKKEYEDCILFFRLGDFYEMFFTDAEVASRELDIVLTSRDGGAERVPMCGVPYHAASTYIGRLLEKGYRVAICDQVEDPKLARGIVKREVTRVITPGTALEEGWLKEDNNFLASVVIEDSACGLAYVDVSTGEFAVCQFDGADAVDKLKDELYRLRPAECLVARWSGDGHIFSNEDIKAGVITEIAPEMFDINDAREKLTRQFGRNALAAAELDDRKEAIQAAGAILSFLEETQKTMMNHIRHIRTYRVDEAMVIDRASRRNLELTANLRDGKTEGSLLWVLDKTRTSMGRRQLRAWLEKPLMDCRRIEERLDAVEELVTDGFLRADLQAHLGFMRDLERLAARIGAGMINPREVLALSNCLQKVPEIKETGSRVKSPLLITLFNLNELGSLREFLEKAIDEKAPVSVRDGGIIKSGYNQQVDELRRIAFAGDQVLLEYESRERERTGIKSLKVGYNKVFGYYIEVTKANLAQVPPDYIRKQTLVNAERFITDELKHFETEVLSARERLSALEEELFNEIRNHLLRYVEDIQTLAMQLAQLDVLAALAEAAVANNYKRPSLTPHGPIIIKGGRHPVVEKSLKDTRFVPNDTRLDPDGERIAVITGPNMGGKSTYLRQVALITIMAQMGSFVPADEAVIGLVDRLFTRVGASDDLSGGQSTFMVEMSEVANIVRYLTPRSLVLLDEVGRGTSTFDGMSIARAIAEYMASYPGVRVLFATHYHELTDLADQFDSVINLCVSVKESGEDVIFLKKVLGGKADKSYGIHVARLAGLPPVITERAARILEQLEESRSRPAPKPVPVQQSLFGDEGHPVLEALKELNVNQLTPLEALNLLEKWQKMLAKGDGRSLRVVRG